MARIEYTWTRSELYNKDGIQIFIIRCNEDNRKKTWEIVENGVARKATHADVSPYIEPDYAARKARKDKMHAARRANYAKYGRVGSWSSYSEELDFSWM